MVWSFATIALVPRGGRAHAPDEKTRSEIFDWAKEAGFDALEMSPRWLDFERVSPRLIEREVREAGLYVSGLNLNRCIYTRTELAQRHVEETRQGIEAAAKLAARIVNISLSMPTLPTAERPPMRGADVEREEFERAAGIVQELADEAGGKGVSISIDLHDDGMLDTPELCLDFLRLVERNNVGINPDVGNICRGPDSVPDWWRAFELLAPKANNWHVKNYRLFQPAPVWEGDIDYTQGMRFMIEAGYDGAVSIESYLPNPMEHQIKALQWLKTIYQSLRGRAVSAA